MMANAVDMQQLLMSMDPSSANQFNAMNKGGACVMATSGGSASPTSSSGAPSSSSILAEAEEKEQFLQNQAFQNSLTGNGNQWMSMFLQQQKLPEAAKLGSDFSEIIQNPMVESNLMEMLANGNGELAKLAAQFAQQSKQEQEAEEQREATPSPPPAVSLNSTLAAMMLPTTSTSTGCSAASTTSSVDSNTSTVIVNGNSANSAEEDEPMPPSAKKSKTEEETPVTPTSNNQFMSLLAQMGLANSLQPQGQKPVKPDEMLFGGLFPQGLGGLPLMFPSQLHQQFAGMPEFDQLAAISTPNKGSGVKRQYSSNGKNYCDICNKEVCNKYFLRTHMLKMHGIVIDENKTVIANIDTSIKEREGELTFRCDTCRTMFKTRNQLRQHRQDVHGVLPLSTPRNNQNKTSVPSTPNSAAPNSATVNDEKCQLCDKRVSPSMLIMHMTQEHFNNPAANGGQDLTHMLSILNQSGNHLPVNEEKDLGLMDCNECSYKTRDAKNLELHLERHHKMNEAKQREDEEDVALKLTTEAALQMVVQNQNQFEGDHSAAALNLTFKNDGIKKDNDEEKAVATQHERNSHTSGSISPSGSIPEGFGKNIGEKPFPTQSFLVRCNDELGEFLTEFLAQLPVRSVIGGPRKITFDLLPAPTSN